MHARSALPRGFVIQARVEVDIAEKRVAKQLRNNYYTISDHPLDGTLNKCIKYGTYVGPALYHFIRKH